MAEFHLALALPALLGLRGQSARREVGSLCFGARRKGTGRRHLARLVVELVQRVSDASRLGDPTSRPRPRQARRVQRLIYVWDLFVSWLGIDYVLIEVRITSILFSARDTKSDYSP